MIGSNQHNMQPICCQYQLYGIFFFFINPSSTFNSTRPPPFMPRLYRKNPLTFFNNNDADKGKKPQKKGGQTETDASEDFLVYCSRRVEECFERKMFQGEGWAEFQQSWVIIFRGRGISKPQQFRPNHLDSA